jgi:nucleotide-binding universal stress UspA family protein
MGTHGRRGWRHALLGSVAEQVLHDAVTPVLTITPSLPDPARFRKIRKIVCPVNFTRVAREALTHAAELAEAFDAELLIVYVAEGMHPSRMAEVEQAFAQWVEPQVQLRCSYERLMTEESDPAERILAIAEQSDADLLVLGAQHRRFQDTTVIGTTTERITRFARCPVLTVMRPANVEEHIDERKLVEVG